MLDDFLEIAYEQDKQASIRQQVVTELKRLPNEELKKIADGETKLAFCDSETSWLDKFKGSPLYHQALQLEEAELQMEAEDIQRSAAERQARQSKWDTRDALRVQKRMLELELRKNQDLGGATIEEGEVEPAEVPEPPVPETEAKEAAVRDMAAARGALIIEEMRKQAVSAKKISDTIVHAKDKVPTERLEKHLGKLKGFASRAFDNPRGVGDLARGLKIQDAVGDAAKALSKSAAMDWSPALAGGGIGTISALAEGLMNPRMRGGTGLGYIAGGALGGQGVHEVVKRLPVSEKAKVVAPLIGMVGGSSLGATIGEHLARDKSKDKPKKGKEPTEKTSSALTVSDAWGREMAKQAWANLDELQKEALLNELKAALPAVKSGLGAIGGAAKTLGTRGLTAFQGAQKGGAGVSAALKAGATGIGRGAKAMVPGAADWIKANPAAAGMMGAGALGAAGLAGHVMS